jgi:hypothetical protein
LLVVDWRPEAAGAFAMVLVLFLVPGDAIASAIRLTAA